MAPSCNLYLSEEDKKIYLSLKNRGENPSALFSKVLRQRAQELDSKTAEMKELQIYEGYESTSDEGTSKLEIVRFVGKRIAAGDLDYDPNMHSGLCRIRQVLYLTRKLNYLLYEQVIQYNEIIHRKTVIERGKPLPSMTLVPEIMNALGVQGEVGTFLDI